MNTIKYTRNIEPFSESNKPTGYLAKQGSLTSPAQRKTNSNGNALKLYKKVDEELKVVSPLIRIVNPIYRLFRKAITGGVWTGFKSGGKDSGDEKVRFSKLNENGRCLNSSKWSQFESCE